MAKTFLDSTYGIGVKYGQIYKNQAVWSVMPTTLTFLTDAIIFDTIFA